MCAAQRMPASARKRGERTSVAVRGRLNLVAGALPHDIRLEGEEALTAFIEEPIRVRAVDDAVGRQSAHTVHEPGLAVELRELLLIALGDGVWYRQEDLGDLLPRPVRGPRAYR